MKTCYNCGAPISKETCEDFPEVCEYWTPKKPTTNADRIRTMTDEELADFFAKIMTYCCVSSINDCSQDCPMYKCCNDQDSDNVEDWLKQEVNDESN